MDPSVSKKMKRDFEGSGEGYLKGAKMMDEGEGVDELLAALGYKVRSSDMADVAQKLEQLEMAIGCGAGAGGSAAAAAGAVVGTSDDAAMLAHLSSDTVHYNPSDLSTWLESMLSELNLPPPPPVPSSGMNRHTALYDFPSLDPPATAESSTITTVTFPGDVGCYDLKPLTAPGQIVYGSPKSRVATESMGRDRKRMRSNSSSSSSSRGTAGGPAASTMEATSANSMGITSAAQMVVVDPQEAGIRLVHALLGCAEAVQQENFKAADALVKQISVLAVSQGGPMRKVAGFFAEALARCIYRINPNPDFALDSTFTDVLHMHFYESCPYLKFAHFTANQAILEAFAGKKRVHVIDFSMKQGMQWPALMQALALRPGGPPSFRLTGIGPPQPDNTDALQQVGWKLAQLADTIHVDFEYRGFVTNSLADLEPYMLDSMTNNYSTTNNSSKASPGDDIEEETVAINSVFELHSLLARPGALEKVLSTVRALRPRIVTVVEQEANHNAGTFIERFTEALHYYSTMFDSIDSGAAGGDGGGQDQMMTEVFFGKQICNVVACEGSDRTERHETLGQWRGRMSRAGLEPVHLGSNAFKQASMLLALFAGGDGYRVDEREGCLTLGWHTRPLIATSAWRLAEPSAAAGAGGR